VATTPLSRAQESTAAAAYVVSYVEVVPASTAEASALLRQYRDASRREAGVLRLELLQRTGRPGHFVLLEEWRDEKALEAHQRADHTRRFRDALEGLRVSPYDERRYSGLAVGSPAPATAGSATYVVTHADAVPAGKDEAVRLLTRLVEASRRERGHLRFDVLQQDSRQNHFTVVEMWNDPKALEAHVSSAQTRQFRDDFQALSGALWDERRYNIVD
jgi:quinol monooxygenase YgiN